jgi:signal peptidase II
METMSRMPDDPSMSRLRWAALLIPAGSVLVVDQLTKRLVMRDIGLGEVVTPIPALADLFGITFSRNTGAAFSILPQLGDIFLMVALVMIVGIVLFYRRMGAGHWPERIALGLLLGGTLGNALDRLDHGFVVDWVLLRLPGVITNVSNLADHAIVIGVGVLFILQLIPQRVLRKKSEQAE